MTIAEVTASRLDLPLHEPFAIAGGTRDMARNVLVRVRLEDGTVGLGEAAPFPEVSGESQESSLAWIDHVAPGLVGKPASGWRAVARELAEQGPDQAAARCGIEMALLDATARQGERPLWQVFGGAGRELITFMTVTAGDARHAARAASSIWQRGIRTIKVKVGALDPSDDAARLRAVHDAAPEADLVIDANGGYDVAAALELLAEVERSALPLRLFEQPVPRRDHDGMATITARSQVPICADESARNSDDVMRISRDALADVVNVKVMKSGIAEALSMISVCTAMELDLMIGGMVESILAMTFSAHLAAGIGGFRHVDLDTPFFVSEHPFRGGYDVEGERLILDADAPGHGVELS